MEMPLSEIIDRFTIVRLKVERIKDPALQKELATYAAAIQEYKHKGVVIDESWITQLYDINGKIWDLEFDIRRGQEGKLGLEEVGRRAIAIRELNKQRVAIKNNIAEATGLGFKDVKMNHASV